MENLAESTGTEPCGSMRGATGSHSPHCHQQWGERSTAPSATAKEPILLSRVWTRLESHAAPRRLRNLAEQAGVQLPRVQQHMLNLTYVTTCAMQAYPSATHRSQLTTLTAAPP